MKRPQSKETHSHTPAISDNDRYYTRHLPHQIPEGLPVFVTWNIKGAIPKHALEALEFERHRLENAHRPGLLPETDRRLLIAKKLFTLREKYLDDSRAGSGNLETAEAAHIVCESLLWGVPERYHLFSFSVMPSHVHGLFTPLIKLRTIMHGLKGFTARQINLIEDQVGRTLWQDESYDHYARDEEEVGRIANYIEQNPVRAGLCGTSDAWPWSSGALRPLLHWEPGSPFDPQWKTKTRAFWKNAYTRLSQMTRFPDRLPPRNNSPKAHRYPHSGSA